MSVSLPRPPLSESLPLLPVRLSLRSVPLRLPAELSVWVMPALGSTGLTLSSLRIVTVVVAVLLADQRVAVGLEGSAKSTKKVSSASTTVSAVIEKEIDCLRVPAAKVRVPGLPA